MKKLCLISAAFAFRIERGVYYPHGELARALFKEGIETTVVCLGPNIDYEDGSIKIHAVPTQMPDLNMLPSWMPLGTYYLSAANALAQKYRELSSDNHFDVVDIPSYLPFDHREILQKSSLVVRAYGDEAERSSHQDPSSRNDSVDRMMMHDMQALATLNADAVLADRPCAAPNHWTEKLKNVFPVPLMAELEATLFDNSLPILPTNDYHTIVVASSTLDSDWFISCLEAIDLFTKTDHSARFILPIFQRELSWAQWERLNILKTNLADAGRLDRLYFINPLTINKINGCLQMADAVVAPLRDSGLPSIGLEALAAGKPIVVHEGNPLAAFVHAEKVGTVINREQDPVKQLVRAFNDIVSPGSAGVPPASTASDRYMPAGRRRSQVGKLFNSYLDAATRCYTTAIQLRADRLAGPGETQHVLTSPANLLLTACDKLLYNVQYQTSLRFRVRHWIKRVSSKAKR